MFVVGTVYNFCAPHASLSQAHKTTPAMAAGITNHCWTMHQVRRRFMCRCLAGYRRNGGVDVLQGLAAPDRAMVCVTTVHRGATDPKFLSLYHMM